MKVLFVDKTDARGSLAGQTHTTNADRSAQVHRKSRPSGQASNSQLADRQAFLLAVKLWKKLSDDDRLRWSQYAQATRGIAVTESHSPFGRQKAVGSFIYQDTIQRAFDTPALEASMEPPVDFNPITLQVFNLRYAGAPANQIRLNVRGIDSSIVSWLIDLSVPVGPARNSRPNAWDSSQFKFETNVLGQLRNVTFTDIIPNKRYFVRLRWEDNSAPRRTHKPTILSILTV